MAELTGPTLQIWYYINDITNLILHKWYYKFDNVAIQNTWFENTKRNLQHMLRDFTVESLAQVLRIEKWNSKMTYMLGFQFITYVHLPLHPGLLNQRNM
jgi:hypothetical protein